MKGARMLGANPHKNWHVEKTHFKSFEHYLNNVHIYFFFSFVAGVQVLEKNVKWGLNHSRKCSLLAALALRS